MTGTGSVIRSARIVETSGYTFLATLSSLTKRASCLSEELQQW